MIIDVDGLVIYQDLWSLEQERFGESGQLQVIGWNGLYQSSKYYFLACDLCSKDLELFPTGIFKSMRSDLVRGTIPCGCGKLPKWSKEQWEIRATRASDSKNLTFKGFVGDWLGKLTKVSLECNVHGEWCTGSLDTLVNRKNSCPGCRTDKVRVLKLKPDSLMIQSFMESGVFPEGTRFWRSNRKTLQGAKVYWHSYCPECQTESESFCGDLQAGKRSCQCSRLAQKECYINLIQDEDNILAIKFGIASISERRLKSQNKSSIYSVSPYITYKFPTATSCRNAERECKRSLICGVMTRYEMPDGFTETTYPYNIEHIIKIYQKYGGVMIMQKEEQ